MERLSFTTPPGVTQSGTLTSGSAVVIALASTTLLLPGQIVTGTGIPDSALVLTVDSATQVTLTANATATGANSLHFVVEPISLAAAKIHLRQDDTYDDALIASLISSARLMCETRLNQAIMQQVVTLSMDEWPFGGGYYNRAIRQAGPTSPSWLPTSTFPLELPMPPVQSINSVKYYDYQSNLITIDPSLYLFQSGTPASIAPVFGKTWPVAQPRLDAVQIAYTVGYATSGVGVPENIKHAMKLMIKMNYDASSPDVTDNILSLLAASDHGAYG